MSATVSDAKTLGEALDAYLAENPLVPGQSLVLEVGMDGDVAIFVAEAA